MTETKKTKRDYLAELLDLTKEYEREEYIPFLEHELELLDNKKKNSRQTKVQKENEKLIELIYNLLNEKPITVKGLQEKDETLKELSSQKISALLKKLVDSEKVEKSIDHKQRVYKKIK